MISPTAAVPRRALVVVVERGVSDNRPTVVRRSCSARGECSAPPSGESPTRRETKFLRSEAVMAPVASGSRPWKRADAVDGQDRGATRFAWARSCCMILSAIAETQGRCECHVTEHEVNKTQAGVLRTHLQQVGVISVQVSDYLTRDEDEKINNIAAGAIK